MTTLADPDSIPAEAAGIIEADMAALAAEVGGELKAWYHDMSMWLVVGPDFHAQATVVPVTRRACGLTAPDRH